MESGAFLLIATERGDAMPRLTKDKLTAANDLVEEDVELPALGGSVRIRSLPAAYSNEAAVKATEMKQVGRDQVLSVDKTKLEALQVYHALIDPKLDTVEEAINLATRLGASWNKLVERIDAISGVDKEEITKAEARFQRSGEGQTGLEVGGSNAGGEGTG